MGLGLLFVFHNVASLRSLLRLTLPLPLLILGIYLFVAPTSEWISAGDAEAAEVVVGKPAPVFLLVFDELPVTSLMTKDGAIDAKRFPNFAHLAEDGSWFRNATTVSAYTHTAVPAILDGRFPEAGGLPLASHHPHSLFTLLGGAMKVESTEIITRVCPGSICGTGEDIAPPDERWSSMRSDLWVISQHVILPEDMNTDLPALDKSWGNFKKKAKTPDQGTDATIARQDPPKGFTSFVKTIEDSPDPVFYFHHAELPHSPWRYLPSGQQYRQEEPVPGTEPLNEKFGTRWTNEKWLITQGYQRHLLQLGLVDKLLGRFIERLEAEGLYEDAVVVVAADHGISFLPGAPNRLPTQKNLGGVAPIPLLVKAPELEGGAVSDEAVRTIDILPTVADALDIEIPWDDIEGRSVLGGAATYEGDAGLRIGEEVMSFPSSGELRDKVNRDKFRLFGVKGDSVDPWRIGPRGTARLVGRTVSSIGIGESAPTGAVAVDGGVYASVDPSGPMFPSLFRGLLDEPSPDLNEPTPIVAVAVNGRVAAVTSPGPGKRDFYAMLDPAGFRKGSNDVTMYLVDGEGDAARLRPLTPSR